MPKLLNRLFCRLWGHKGPQGTAYKLRRTSLTTAVVAWECPRCGESERAMMLGIESPGEVIDATPFRPSIHLWHHASDAKEPDVLVPMRHGPRRRLALVSTGLERNAIPNKTNIKIVKSHE